MRDKKALKLFGPDVLIGLFFPDEDTFQETMDFMKRAIPEEKHSLYLENVAAMQLMDNGDSFAGVLLYDEGEEEMKEFATFSFSPSTPGILYVGLDSFIC